METGEIVGIVFAGFVVAAVIGTAVFMIIDNYKLYLAANERAREKKEEYYNKVDYLIERHKRQEEINRSIYKVLDKIDTSITELKENDVYNNTFIDDLIEDINNIKEGLGIK